MRSDLLILEAWSCASARAVLETAGEGPLLALIDRSLPDASGFELAAEIRQTRPDSKIITMSWERGEQITETARTAGAVHHFVKPVPLVQLVLAVELLVALHAQYVRAT